MYIHCFLGVVLVCVGVVCFGFCWVRLVFGLFFLMGIVLFGFGIGGLSGGCLVGFDVFCYIGLGLIFYRGDGGEFV